MLKITAELLAWTGATLACATANAQVTFTRIDPLGGDSASYAQGVSADGTVVVGGSKPTPYDWPFTRPLRWTGSGGSSALAVPTGAAQGTFLQGVSGDGTTAVGQYTRANGTMQAARWTAAGVEDLGAIAGLPNTWVKGVSHNGSTVVGGADDGVQSLSRPIIWSGSGSGSDLAPGRPAQMAFGISGDGATAFYSDATSTGFYRSVLGGEEQYFGLFLGAYQVIPTAVSADGTAAVGFFTRSGGPYDRAFRWTLAGGATELLPLVGQVHTAMPLACSADGSVVVGYGQLPGMHSAFVWTESGGMVSLGDVLTAGGVNLTGWNLFEATGVSADGRTIVGDGTFNGEQRGWIATIPAPGGLVGATLFVGPLLRRRRRNDDRR